MESTNTNKKTTKRTATKKQEKTPKVLWIMHIVTSCLLLLAAVTQSNINKRLYTLLSKLEKRVLTNERIIVKKIKNRKNKCQKYNTTVKISKKGFRVIRR